MKTKWLVGIVGIALLLGIVSCGHGTAGELPAPLPGSVTVRAYNISNLPTTYSIFVYSDEFELGDHIKTITQTEFVNASDGTPLGIVYTNDEDAEGVTYYDASQSGVDAGTYIVKLVDSESGNVWTSTKTLAGGKTIIFTIKQNGEGFWGMN